MAEPLSPLDWFTQFGIDQDWIRRVLAEATIYGADDADLYFEHPETTSVGLSDGAVNRASPSIDLGVGVRVVVGDWCVHTGVRTQPVRGNMNVCAAPTPRTP